MPEPSPKEFQPYRRVQAQTEHDLRQILESTARAIQKRIAALPVGVGGQVRAAQLRTTFAAIKKLQQAMWTGSVSPRVQRAVDDAEKAAESAVEAMTRVAYASLPDAAAEELVRGLRLAAESGLKSDAARRKRELSQRVYRQRAFHDGKVEDTIREGLIANLSAKELAESVYNYVSPTTPGGASYAAMRLARTEINNAFHERQLEGAKRPGVKAVKWNLSGSHTVPDLCNKYAAHGGNGQWPVGQVPDKPHPQCFCYLTYVTQPPDQFRKALANGDFDKEIDRRTRENLARLGQSTGTVKAKDDVEPAKKTAPTKKVTPIRKNKPLTGEAVHALVKRGLFKEGTLTKPQKRAIETYESGWYGVIQMFLRGGEKIEDREDERTARTIADMDSAMEPLGQPIQTWRGMYHSKRLFEDRLDGDLTGFEWDEMGYSSTSTQEKIADSYNVNDADFHPRQAGQNVKMNLTVSADVKAVELSTINRGSPANGPQAEITLQRGTRWRVVKDHGKHPTTGSRLLDVEVVPRPVQ